MYSWIECHWNGKNTRIFTAEVVKLPKNMASRNACSGSSENTKGDISLLVCEASFTLGRRVRLTHHICFSPPIIDGA